MKLVYFLATLLDHMKQADKIVATLCASLRSLSQTIPEIGHFSISATHLDHSK